MLGGQAGSSEGECKNISHYVPIVRLALVHQLQRLLIEERMFSKIAIALMTTLLLSGCYLSSYRPASNESEPSPLTKTKGVIHFSFYPPEVAAEKSDRKSPMASLPIEPSLLQQYLEKYSVFTTALLSSTAQVKGPHIVLTKTALTEDDFKQNSCVLGLVTLFILPCYMDRTSSTLRYDVYEGDQILKSYAYEIKFRRVWWWGLLPFFLLHGIMTQYSESCEAITAQFLVDAHADGYL